MIRRLIILLLIVGCVTESEDCVGVILWNICYDIEETTKLDLYNSGLSGEIPREIGKLTNLTQLNLSKNQLSGEILPEIGNLTNLTFLKLTDNQLTGQIPQQVCDWMESINLSMGSIINGNNLTNTCE